MTERIGTALLTLGMAIAAISCIAISGYFNFLFGHRWGETALDALALGACFVALDALKSLLPVAIATGFRNRKPLYVMAGSLAFVALVALSISSAIGFYAQARGAKTADAQSVLERIKSLRTDIADIKVRLSANKLGYQQISGSIKADIEALKTHRRWGATAQCTNATATASRAFCAGYHAKQAALAAAVSIETDRALLTVKQTKLDRILAAGGLRPPNPQAETLAALIPGISALDVEFALRLALPVMVEIGGAFGLFFAFKHGGAPTQRTYPDIREISRLRNEGARRIPKLRNPDICGISGLVIADGSPEYGADGKLIIEGELL